MRKNSFSNKTKPSSISYIRFCHQTPTNTTCFNNICMSNIHTYTTKTIHIHFKRVTSPNSVWFRNFNFACMYRILMNYFGKLNSNTMTLRQHYDLHLFCFYKRFRHSCFNTRLNVTHFGSLNERIIKCAFMKHWHVLHVHKIIAFKYEYWCYKYTNKSQEKSLYFLTFKSVSFTEKSSTKLEAKPVTRSN
jgi:hypothetical protein